MPLLPSCQPLLIGCSGLGVPDTFRKQQNPTTPLWHYVGFLYSPYERLTKPAFPDAILLTENAKSPFNSLTKYWDDENGQSVFKLFSTSSLDAASLDMLFSKHNIVIEHHWKAYPKFSPPEVPPTHSPVIKFGSIANTHATRRAATCPVSTA